ncbi:MAG: response regulator [Roseiflexaceae bacterium]|jgi:DNA-binding response OmpR family regulator|nr:response regulator transcription factor [Chloroflexaceae bacterium]MCE2852243.1 response regulator transcription factor [Chloroflexaceae bacterium]
MPTILLVEDDATLAETLRYNLEREGYAVISASDGVTALEYARQRQPDIVVLDVMLPRLDGFSVCRMLRKESAMPIIMLTARQDEVDRIAGLELGADDYLTKPFSVGELLARIRAILRRSDRSASTVERDILHIGVIKLDVGSRRIWRDDTEIQLSQKEFDLLACLMRNRGLALSRDVLLERVWGFDYVGDGRTVDVHIRWLREKVEQDPSNPVYLQTVRGIGYRFDVPNN